MQFSSEYVPGIEDDYIDPFGEFVAWDELSDEALANFEKALQNARPDLEIMCDALLLCLKIFSKIVLPRLAALESRSLAVEAVEADERLPRIPKRIQSVQVKARSIKGQPAFKWDDLP